MKTKLKKMDHLGNGIGFYDGKVVFLPKTITYDEVEFKKVKETKTYIKGKVIKYLKRGEDYIKPFCPFYYDCGGCNLQNYSYEKTLEYKKDRVLNILNNLDITCERKLIANKYPLNYRNKIQLKIRNSKIGFYQSETNNIVEIDKCNITKEAINKFIAYLPNMNIKNGDVLIRCNYNNELLVSIKTNDIVNVDSSYYPDLKVLGIIIGDKCIYGEDKFLDKINDLFFEVSYDAFFQVNSYINSKLFEIINNNVDGDVVLDLYSGVGTLSLMASRNAKKVFAIENIPNAVINGIKNAKINNISNINFILGNVEDKIQFINQNINTIIVDPPRSGLDKITINKILQLGPQKIIYISCETQKLAYDLQMLSSKYEVKKLYILDMFSYTYHVECVALLSLKTLE